MPSPTLVEMRNDDLHTIENLLENYAGYLVKILIGQIHHRFCDSPASVVYPDIHVTIFFESLAPKIFNIASPLDICWHNQRSGPSLFRNFLQLLLSSCREH